jgi:CRISPR system Cascade subunit CasD
MTVLVLRLAAPLQSWGTESRFTRRTTGPAPSRSGVIGMLAAAKGLQRTDPLDELRQLRIGVRTEQPGHVVRDFHTAWTRDGATSMPLSHRYYLSDAVFAVAIEGDATLLDDLQQALRRPVFPIYLGRRSCPPAGRLVWGVRDGDVTTVLESLPWLASPAVRKAAPPVVQLTVHRDCDPADPTGEVVRDDPISFDPGYRQWGWRTVKRYRVDVPNPDSEHDSRTDIDDSHDPLAPLREAL